MMRPSDQVLAKRMLETRERGISFGLVLRRSMRGYLFLFLVFGVVLGWLAWIEYWPPFVLMLGMLVGCLLRDVGWIRRIKQTWPFTLKVTDWEIVRELAEEPDATGGEDGR